MEQITTELYEVLKKLVGLHRSLLETVRAERDALLDMNVKEVEEASFAKQALLSSVVNAETKRKGLVAEIAVVMKKPADEITLEQVIVEVQGFNMKQSEQLRSILNTLKILIDRIKEQNKENAGLVEGCMSHLQTMKDNAIQELANHSAQNTYSKDGQSKSNPGGARLISKEA